MKQVREHRDDLVARLPALQVAFVALLLLVVAAYWNVQVVQGDHFRRLAENNRMRTVPLEAPRGLIFDRGGRLLVENVPSYNLLFDRSRSRDRRADLAWAAGVLERTVEELEGALAHHLDGDFALGVTLDGLVDDALPAAMDLANDGIAGDRIVRR